MHDPAPNPNANHRNEPVNPETDPKPNPNLNL